MKTILDIDMEVKNMANINKPGKRNMLLEKARNHVEQTQTQKKNGYLYKDLTMKERKLAVNVKQIKGRT